MTPGAVQKKKFSVTVVKTIREVAHLSVEAGTEAEAWDEAERLLEEEDDPEVERSELDSPWEVEAVEEAGSGSGTEASDEKEDEEE